jgi:hypothetical protein
MIGLARRAAAAEINEKGHQPLRLVAYSNSGELK